MVEPTITELIRVLKESRQLVAKPENWTQQTMAQNEFKDDVFPTDVNAICFCALGAITKVLNLNLDSVKFTMNLEEQEQLLYIRRLVTQQLEEDIRDEYLTEFNDNHTHTEVLNAFDKTIARLEKAYIYRWQIPS